MDSNNSMVVTKAKRDEAIQKLLKQIQDEFEGIDITAAFTKKLLEDCLIELDKRVYSQLLKGDVGQKIEEEKEMDVFDGMSEFRCPNCNKLFFRYRLKGELVAHVKCTRCKAIATLKVTGRW